MSVLALLDLDKKSRLFAFLEYGKHFLRVTVKEEWVCEGVVEGGARVNLERGVSAPPPHPARGVSPDRYLCRDSTAETMCSAGSLVKYLHQT